MYNVNQFEAAVEEGRDHILIHPVIKALHEVRWKFVKPHFYIHAIFYGLFTLLWSVDFSYGSFQQQHIYNFPEDSWRIIVQVYKLLQQNFEFILNYHLTCK